MGKIPLWRLAVRADTPTVTPFLGSTRRKENADRVSHARKWPSVIRGVTRDSFPTFLPSPPSPPRDA